MRIGVPKEIKTLEFRVGMTPAGAHEMVHDGHEVFVETNAGAGIGVTDADYEAAGAKVLGSAEAVFEKAEMIVKVKEPQLNECEMLRPGQVIFTYLHLAPDPKQTEALVKSGTTAIAYETVTADDGSLPLLVPMSEVAGRLSIQAGAFALQKANGGSGKLLGGVPGVLPAKVLEVGPSALVPPPGTPPVAELRRLFRAVGCDPTRYRPSSEALLRRLIKGAELPEIHPLVDLNNCLSAATAVPCCVMRDGSFGSRLVFRAGQPGESYESLRGPFNLEARYRAGFTQEEMAALEGRG